MKKVDCAICGKKQRVTNLYSANINIEKLNKKIFSARRLPDRLHYKIVKCLRCGLIFSQDIVNVSKINELYGKSDISYKKESKYLGKTYLSYFNKYLRPSINAKILDIGAGNGFFLKALYENGFNDVWGVEPGRPMVNKSSKHLQKRIIPSILKKGLFKKNSFDVICCFHTFDHIVDVNEFLKTVYSLLKPSGKIFFVVHNTDGLSVKLFGEKSPIFDVEHIYLFNRSTLAKIFKKNGFKKTVVFSHYNTYPLSYWFHLFPLPIKTKKIILKFLDKNIIGNIPLKINPGNIGIIAQK